MPLPSISPHNWPDDYADGENQYECVCSMCNAHFFGVKSRILCRVCHFGNDIAFQFRVKPWMDYTFGPKISNDKVERNHRFFEEAAELVQSLGMTRSECHQLVDYVFDRPVGEPFQELGGVEVTLAALALANQMDKRNAGDVELMRIWGKAEQIRAKQAAKPKHSPLPQAVDNPLFKDLLASNTPSEREKREKWLYGTWDGSPEPVVMKPELHIIPPMNDEMGRHWVQPPRTSIEITPILAIMTRASFDMLKDYSTSLPSGVYPGKMWKCRVGKDAWELRWFGHVPNNVKVCSNNARRIFIKHDLYETKDKDKPNAICDRNGEVALGLCKICGQTEATLEDQCPGRKK